MTASLVFFPRVETKASFLFVIDTGLLGLTAARLHREDWERTYIVLLALLFFGLMLGSLGCIYRSVFPNLKGGTDSLVYFREIAKRTESEYEDSFLSRTDANHVADVARQIWINSQILRFKFDHLKSAFSLTFLAILPWVALVASIAMLRSPFSLAE